MYTISDQPGFKLSSNIPKAHLDALVSAKHYTDTRHMISSLKRSLKRLLVSAARIDPALECDLREIVSKLEGVIARIQEEARAQLATAEKAVRDFQEEPTP